METSIASFVPSTADGVYNTCRCIYKSLKMKNLQPSTTYHGAGFAVILGPGRESGL